MSMLFQQVVKQLAIKASGYHQQSQGVFKKFHSTMNNMMQTYCLDHQKEWDEGIPFLIFVARESVEVFLGFSPFEFTFEHSVRGPLKLIKEKWLQDNPSREYLLDCVERFRAIIGSKRVGPRAP